MGEQSVVVSRWEQIRQAAASAGSENPVSAWERLRRKEPVSSPSRDDHSSPPLEAEGHLQRAAAQAEFDKMLEEERKRASS